MRAVTILRFARTMRWATARSWARKAWAIWDVVRPATARSVRATCASRASAGWQQVKIRRSRSSGSSAGASDAATSCSFSASRVLRRTWSSALRRAVSASQAPGLAGTPVSGQCSRASTIASWTSSSAMSKSPRRRTSELIRRPASSRKTRETAASAGLHRPLPVRAWPAAGSAAPGTAVVTPLHPLAFADGPDLDFVAARPGPGHGHDRVEVGGLHDRVAADGLLGLQEGAVGDQAALRLNRRGRAGGLQLVTALDRARRAVLSPPLADPGVQRLHVLR